MAFSWVPSGATVSFFNHRIWVRPRSAKSQFSKIEFPVTWFEEPNPGGSHKKPIETGICHAPHADIIFDNGALRLDIDRTKDGFTRYDVGPFHSPDTLTGKHLDWVMASAHYLNPADGNTAHPAGLKMIADSGGAQMKFRTADYVDPEHVIHAYNCGADFGMALDLPPRPNVDGRNKVALQILAEIQRKNNQIFKAKRRPDLGLLNVVHGIQADDYRLWADIVNDPEHFQGWAIGLDDLENNVCIFRGAAVLYREYGLKENPSQWLHLFGVSGPKTIPVMAWLGRYIPILTSDSSSYLEGCRRRTYFLNDGGNIVSQSTGEGKTMSFEESGFSHSSLLPCCCEFCSLIRYFGVHSSREFQTSFPALYGHNLIVLREVASQWNTLASTLELKDYVELVRKRIGSRSAVLVQYVDACLNQGPEYADKHFSGYLYGGGGLHNEAVEARTRQQKTRLPIFSSATSAAKPTDIHGLSVPGSNLEIIGNYLSDVELENVYSRFGFENHLRESIAKQTGQKHSPQASEDALLAEIG